MELLNLSIRELNNLFVNKKAKPSELYSEIFDRAANSEAALHAHLSLFEETNLEITVALYGDTKFESIFDEQVVFSFFILILSFIAKGIPSNNPTFSEFENLSSEFFAFSKLVSSKRLK